MGPMAEPRLSIAEYTVLGIVWREGPCTTYAVMRELSNSSSTFYRKRASSTYRVAQRLVDLGFLSPVGEGVGARGDRLLEATAKGRAELRRWLTPPTPQFEVDHSMDLVRLRVFFLGALPAGEQRAFLEAALKSLKVRLVKQEEDVATASNEFEALGSLGGVYETKARMAWLEEVKRRLD